MEQYLTVYLYGLYRGSFTLPNVGGPRYRSRYSASLREIECQWGRDCPHTSRPALGPTQPPIELYPLSFPGVKWTGRVDGHPPPSSAKVKERVELYLYPLPGPPWPLLGWTLPFIPNVGDHPVSTLHFRFRFAVLAQGRIFLLRVFAWVSSLPRGKFGDSALI